MLKYLALAGALVCLLLALASPDLAAGRAWGAWGERLDAAGGCEPRVNGFMPLLGEQRCRQEAPGFRAALRRVWRG